MDTALALWIQRFFLYLWVTAWFLLQFRVFGRRFCHRASNMHVPCAARPSKCSKGDLLLKPSCFHFFPPSFFTVFLSPGPDNPPYPWLISRKGTGQQWAQGWVLKMHVLPLNTHTHTQEPTGNQSSLLRGRERELQGDKNLHTAQWHAWLPTAWTRHRSVMTKRTFPELRGDKQREGLRPQRCEGGHMCVCGNEGWFRVGGPLPVNCVSSAFCLPINWPCGVYPTGQAARERSQVLRENSTTALHSLWDVKTKNQKVSCFVFAHFYMSRCFQYAAFLSQDSHSSNMEIDE